MPAGAWTRRSLYLKVRDRAVLRVRHRLGGGGARPRWRRGARRRGSGWAAWPTARGGRREAEAAADRQAADRGRGGSRGRGGDRGRRQPRRQRLQARARAPDDRPRFAAGQGDADPDGRCEHEPWIAAVCSASRTPGSTASRRSPARPAMRSDEPVANPAYACLVTSAIARGRIARLQPGRGAAVPGVLDILTHDNVGDQTKPPLGPDRRPDHHHAGDRPHLARRPDHRRGRRRHVRGGERGGRKVRVDYDGRDRRAPPSTAPGAEVPAAKAASPEGGPTPTKATREARSPPRRSRSTRAIRRRPSTTTRSSCSPRPAPGTGRSSPSTSPASPCTA